MSDDRPSGVFLRSLDRLLACALMLSGALVVSGSVLIKRSATATTIEVVLGVIMLLAAIRYLQLVTHNHTLGRASGAK